MNEKFSKQTNKMYVCLVCFKTKARTHPVCVITELKLQTNKQIYVSLEHISLNGPIDGEGLQIAHLYNGPRIFCDFIRRTPIKSIINIEGKMKYASGIIIKKNYMTYVDRLTRFSGESRNFRTGARGPNVV